MAVTPLPHVCIFNPRFFHLTICAGFDIVYSLVLIPQSVTRASTTILDKVHCPMSGARSVRERYVVQ